MARYRSHTLCRRKSPYTFITVRDEGGYRALIFGRKKLFGRYAWFGRDGEDLQNLIHLRDPEKPTYGYLAMIFVGFLYVRHSRRLMLAGLGGAYIPNLIRRYLPGVRLDVLEIDPVVAELAERYFSFKQSDSIRAIVSDGRKHLEQTPHTYDQIMLDAFSEADGSYIPRHLMTYEFLQLAKSRLSDGGVILQNTHQSNALFNAQVATYRAAFQSVHLFQGDFETIILASDAFLQDPGELHRQLSQAGETPGVGPIDLLQQLARHIPLSNVPAADVLRDLS